MERLIGKVRAGKEGPPIGVEPHRHRPTALSRHRLDCLHVDGVDVGPFLAIDFDVHKEPVHLFSSLRVLERLMGHDMTPVTGRVSNAKQYGDIAISRLGERLVTPLVPIDRIIHVLEEIRRGGVGKTIGHR